MEAFETLFFRDTLWRDNRLGLHRIQEGKTQLKQIEQELMRKIYDNLDSTNPMDKQILRSILSDIARSEELLLESHRQFMDQR